MKQAEGGVDEEEKPKPKWYLHLKSADGLEKFERVAYGSNPPQYIQRAMLYHGKSGLYTDSEMLEVMPMVNVRRYEYVGTKIDYDKRDRYEYDERARYGYVSTKIDYDKPSARYFVYQEVL